MSESDLLRTYLSVWSVKYGDILDLRLLLTERLSGVVSGRLRNRHWWKPVWTSYITSGYHFLLLSRSTAQNSFLSCPSFHTVSKLENEAVRVAVGLRFDLDLCIPHHCRCGSLIDACNLRISVCKTTPGQFSYRHHDLIDLVTRSFVSAGFPVTKELVVSK